MTAAQTTRRLVWAVVILGHLTVSGILIAAPQVVAPPELPKDARAALKHQWPGWTEARPDPQATACRAADGGARTLQMADLDGDGNADYALAVNTGTEVRLVGLVYRPWGFVLHDLDSLGQQTATRSLEIRPRGQQFTNPRTQLRDFYPADTVAASACGGDTAVYMWRGSGFDKVVLPG
jgi:hypothetical protein